MDSEVKTFKKNQPTLRRKVCPQLLGSVVSVESTNQKVSQLLTDTNYRVREEKAWLAAGPACFTKHPSSYCQKNTSALNEAFV